ncbi:PAS domain S-box protein [Lentimicrobium sp. S6]|uniref:PAS domain S-box protein n=1 Tax=Lentimicrobium sp. S6 TaxID=2735872 RepID=UPI001553813C|nr:PAS domain S-box protein [Lentimicrobium sp. S6]NPD46035.1 PAS domain S-box protein [Lentimicrobium sp. S6]
MGKGRHTEDELYHFLFNTSSDILAIQNFHHEILDVNEEGLKKIGYQASEVLGQPISKIQKKYSLEELEGITQKLMEKGEAKFESLFLCKDGSELPVEVIAKVIAYKGAKAVYTQSRDVSELKESQQKLALQQQASLKIFSALDGIVYVSDPFSFEILFANQELIDSLGVEQSIIGKKCYQVMQGLDSPCSFCTNPIIFNNKKNDSYVWEFQNKQNNHWYRCYDRVIEWFNGKNVRLELAVDITEEKERRLQIEDLNLHLKSIVDSPKDYALFRLKIDLQTNNAEVLMISDSIIHLFGISPQEKNTFASWFENVHPKDIKTVFREIYRNLKPPFKHQMKFRIVHPERGIRYFKLEATGIAYRQEAELLEYSNGFIIDITDSVLATQALKESEERYQLATAASESGIWDWKLKDNSVFYSDQWKGLLGYQAHELGNEFSTWEDLLHPDDKERMINTVQAFLEKPKNFFIEEFRMKHKDETYRWIHNKAAAVLDKNANVIRMFGAHTDITKEKKTIDHLIKSKEDYKQLFEQAHDAILTFNPEDEVILEANKAACEVYGYSYQEFVGSSITNFSKNPKKGKLRIDQTQKDGVYTNFETTQYHKDGRELHFEINASLINYQGNKAILSINRNITERKKVELALIDSEANLMSVLESSQDAIWSVDREFKLLTINSKFRNEFHYNYGVKLNKGNCILDFVSKETADLWKSRYLRVFSGESVVEIDQFEIDHKPYYFEITINPIVYGQHISGASVVSKDVSERERTQQLLLIAKNQAEENNRMKSYFLANMSHEIRTPMNGIMGFADLLKEEDLSEKEKGLYISVIERSGGKMLRLINNIIDISRIESGQMNVDYSEVNVNELLYFQYAFFSPEAERNGLELKLETPNIGELNIWSDSTKIADIFTNLIKNSIKYTKEGQISFGYSILGKTIKFFVKDTGIGISEPKQKLIFERFVQAEKVDNKVTEGAGLGLSITKAYVELLGGSIELKSCKHKGTEFIFTLPIKGKLKN